MRAYLLYCLNKHIFHPVTGDQHDQQKDSNWNTAVSHAMRLFGLMKTDVQVTEGLNSQVNTVNQLTYNHSSIRSCFTIRLLEHDYVALRLKSSLQNGGHHELVDRYNVSICTMKTDLFKHLIVFLFSFVYSGLKFFMSNSTGVS